MRGSSITHIIGWLIHAHIRSFVQRGLRRDELVYDAADGRNMAAFATGSPTFSFLLFGSCCYHTSIPSSTFLEHQPPSFSAALHCRFSCAGGSAIPATVDRFWNAGNSAVLALIGKFMDLSVDCKSKRKSQELL
jgi:hypothetical protein